MCDLCGFIAAAPASASTILSMTNLARHRGPDDEGYLLVREPGMAPELFGGSDTPAAAYRSGAPFAPAAMMTASDQPVTVAFGHRRLSILDLSVLGHQPMCTTDRRYWLIYNGEIYNYAELAEELKALGYRFLSHSDSEVILAAYATWGAAGLHKLNGMFAFAIYDAEAATLFLARDRFGIKPMYYWIAPSGVWYFASEIKQFTAAPDWTPRLNLTRVREFLATGLTDCSDETMFAGVYHLPPGHCATLSIRDVGADGSGRIGTDQWYRLAPAPFDGTFEEAAAAYHRLLADSVRLMLRADVPIGSCLSGGIDSSSIVCLMNRELRRQGAAALQKTFTARADEPRFDEWPWVEEVVRTTGVDARSVVPSLDLLQAEFAKFSWHQDEPVATTSYFAEWSVYGLVRQAGLKVMLDGQGADEVLAGYHAFFAPYLASLVRDGRWREAWREIRAFKRRHGYSEAAALRGIARVLLPPRDPRFASVSALAYAQVTHSNLQMMLRCADRSAMAHSVESRVPFLDHRVVEFALGLPDAFKIGGGVTKRVLRGAMSGVLPDRIRDRVDKIGFETPESSWMTGAQRSWFRGRLADAVEITNRFVPASTLIRLDAMAAGTRPFDREPWRAISLGEWMRAFAVAAPLRGRSLPS
jgi:asparagine synthase (glutamine-hydrolysing)